VTKNDGFLVKWVTFPGHLTNAVIMVTTKFIFAVSCE